MTTQQNSPKLDAENLKRGYLIFDEFEHQEIYAFSKPANLKLRYLKTLFIFLKNKIGNEINIFPR